VDGVYNIGMERIQALVPGISPLTQRQKVSGALLFVSYFALAYFGSKLFVSPAVIVPAAGVALAGLVLEGVTLWPAIYAAALLLGILSGYSLPSLIFIPLAQTLQPMVGALILKDLGFDPLLRRLRDMFALMGVALAVSIIVPTLGSLALFINALLGHPLPTSVTWGSWWVGQILSLLVVAPLIIRWFAEPRFFINPVYRRPQKIIEIALVLATLLAVDWLIAWGGVAQVSGISLVYFLLVPLFWLAIRVGPRFTILGLFFTTVILIAGTLYGPSAASAPALGERLFQMQIFLDIIAIIFYIIAGLQEERTETTKSLESYVNRLESALNSLSLQDKAKNDFIAILAHELRNPLAPIVSALELIKINHPKSGEEAEALDLMDDRLKTIGRLLDDLLDVSRISRSKLNLQKEPVDVRTIIEHSIQSIDRHISTRNQTLVINVPNEPLILDADPVRIEQIISNLLNNASKFTPPGGRLAISAEREGRSVAIRVEDNGIGIDPLMLERIFEAFLQLETGNRGEGLGIGLSLTQKLVEMHGGTIEAQSEGKGKGSEFTVRLPILMNYKAPVLPQATKEAVSSKPIFSPAGQRILVVDDNAAAAHGIGRLLKHKGYEVEYAYSGTEAREKVSASGPTAIVLDIGLPDMDGYELARAMRSGLDFHGTIVALTGYGQEEDKKRAYEAGFNHHLTKPVSIGELEAVLSRS
jgi:signal transduction histidine kinase/CheY-like chemotaxis protein